MSTDGPFFVVFDTSTQARYYSDVHELMALPAGAVIRYEYKRYLCTPEASATLDKLIDDPTQLPVDALLMYGEKRSFRKGDPDPAEMLRKADSIFIPTRSCRIVNVGKVVGASRDQDKLHFHLEVRGFVDPTAPAVDQAVNALEAADALPFGEREKQHRWVALLPAELGAQRPNLVAENSVNWSKVVDAIILQGAQFKDDVFWRVSELREVTRKGDAKPIRLIRRSNNKQGDPDRWHVDHELIELKGYEIVIETHSPQAHGRNVPGDATVAVINQDDEDTLLRIPTTPVDVVPNQSSVTQFRVASDLRISGYQTTLKLETQVPDASGPYPPGSSAVLTVAIRKERWRLILAALLGLTAIVLGALAATLGNDAFAAKLATGIGATLSAVVGYWAFRGELKLR